MKRAIFTFVALTSALTAFALEPNPLESSSKKDDVLGAIQRPEQELKISLDVKRHQLKNGLTVLLLEDHTVPMISYHTWYKVGSRHEGPGITGAAHMLEHMMFKGAKKWDGKAFDQTLHSNGMVNNAFTTFDYTGFFQILPSDKLDLMMQMEVDRMSSLAIRQEDLNSERQVVAEERRWRIDNSPMGVMRESLFASLFKGTPYGWPVIGYMKDIQAYESEKLRYFYENFYTPNNAVLVLVGDFDSNKAIKMIEKYYGDLPSRQTPAALPYNYKAKPGETVTVKKDVQAPSVAMAYRSAPVMHPDTYALDLASAILGSNKSSRLYRSLVVRQQNATSVSSFQYSLKEDGTFMLFANLKSGVEVDGVVNQMAEEIARLRSVKVSATELENAKIQFLTGFVDELTSMEGKARQLASYEIQTGHYNNLFVDVKKYQEVTAEDIMRVARKYLRPELRTLTILQPK